MIQSIENKYANLLVDYCLQLKEGHQLYIKSSTAGEPLVREVYREAMKRGALVEFDLSFAGQYKIWMEEANEAQLRQIGSSYKKGLMESDAYLVIRAPHNLREDADVNTEKSKMRSDAVRDVMKAYSTRTADGSMCRSLCQYPTQASAQMAGMSLDDYQQFVYGACRLDEDDPIAAWLKVREEQQHIVDYLNRCKKIQYLGENIDLTFGVEGRTWINSDGRTNMPSGEVFTGPVEDSGHGHVKFSYPSIYMGEEVSGVSLKIEKGKVVSWDADQNKDFLDKIFQMKGSRYFGEIAVGTNYKIQRMTKNILFDEKIGGTIHMAIGQSYLQTGGKNKSPIHWDMITDMTNGGQILADDKVIYDSGAFVL